ncbi:MAG: SufB/SufD family protein [Candidatus Limnocylindrales bacterium]
MSPTDPFAGLAFVTDARARELARELEEPAWLAKGRLEAVRRYADLPAEKNQLFTLYQDFRLARFAELTPYGIVRDGPAPTTRLPKGAAAFLHVREDAVVARGLAPEAEAAGVTVDTFGNVQRSHPELLRDVLKGMATLPQDDKFAQLAQAAAVVGVLVHVPDGVELAGPIVLRWSVGAGGRALISRTAVALGRGARVSLLEEQRASDADEAGADPDAAQSLWSGTLEVALAESASLDVAVEQDFGPRTVSFVNRQATIGEAATLRWALAHVGGLIAKSRVDNWLVGRAGTVHQAEIGFGGGQQLFDLTSYTHHVGRDTSGDLLSKGVFQDRARGFFKGLIEIQRSAVGTDSFLGEFAMLLDRKARSVAIPSLEMDQPDVRRASHSSSVGPIDENQLFYLESRGLPPDLARKFIVLGFLEPVVARIPLPEAQDRLRNLLDRKWHGGHEAATAA